MKFKPDIEFVWNEKRKKIVPLSSDVPQKDNTFCFESQFLAIMINEGKMKTFLIKENQNFWGYVYNLLFETIDFDTNDGIWLCKVLGYIE